MRDHSRSSAHHLAASGDDVTMSRATTSAVLTVSAPSSVKRATASARPVASAPASKHRGPASADRHRGDATPRYRLFRVLRI
jgi:hypothetical protein